jgi:hypothetical protein
MKSNERKITRRDFLIAAGCGCAGLVLAGSGCSRLRGTTAASALVCPFGYRNDPWPGQCYRYVDSNGSGYCDYSEAMTATGSETTTQAGNSTARETLVILCDRGCSAPGQCGRFIDSDGSGICDLSEGVVVDAASVSVATATLAASTNRSTAFSSVTASATATPAAQSTIAAGSASTSSELVILCDRGCSYPGNCGRYTDSNGTGRCDLSEGIPADQAANYGGFGGPGGRGGRGG